MQVLYEVYADHLYHARHFTEAALSPFLPLRDALQPNPHPKLTRPLVYLLTVFSLASNKPRAMKSYEKAHAWKELFTLALTEKLEEGEIAEMCERVASESLLSVILLRISSPSTDAIRFRSSDHLASRGKYVEAGRIWLDYGHDLSEAVSAFCKGRDFSEAYRVVRRTAPPICSLCKSSDLNIPLSIRLTGRPQRQTRAR